MKLEVAPSEYHVELAPQGRVSPCQSHHLSALRVYFGSNVHSIRHFQVWVYDRSQYRILPAS